jgi:hypothetical protein
MKYATPLLGLAIVLASIAVASAGFMDNSRYFMDGNKLHKFCTDASSTPVLRTSGWVRHQDWPGNNSGYSDAQGSSSRSCGAADGNISSECTSHW